MEPEVWSARIALSKRAQLLEASQILIDRQLNTDDDLEAEEELHTDFVCPYCDEEYDITSLCSHLEAEHCSDGQLNMCPVCAMPVDDVFSHIDSQHADLKASGKRLFRKPKDITGSLQDITGSLQDITGSLQAVLGGQGQGRTSESYFSSLVSGFSNSETEDVLTSAVPLPDAALPPDEESLLEAATSCELLTSEETEEATCRAMFAQHLVLSTLWPEL